MAGCTAGKSEIAREGIGGLSINRAGDISRGGDATGEGGFEGSAWSRSTYEVEISGGQDN